MDTLSTLAILAMCFIGILALTYCAMLIPVIVVMWRCIF